MNMKNEKRNSLRALTEGAIMAALAAVLNFLRFEVAPQGGSVDLVFIPLIIYSLRWGCPQGMLAGFVFGTLKAIIDGGIAYGWQSMLLDYSVAYALVALSGLLPRKPVLATVLGAMGCLSALVVSGVLIWSEYMPEIFWGMRMNNIWIYSLIYNGSFVLVNCIIAALVIGILAKTTNLIQAQKPGKQVES